MLNFTTMISAFAAELCPMPQFEALVGPPTLAWKATRKYRVDEGLCAGTSFEVVPMGVYTTVLRVTGVTNCPRHILLEKIKVLPVLVPSEYFSEEGTYREFADFEESALREPATHRKRSAPSAAPEGRYCPNGKVLLHATFDWGTPNMWHSGASLHALWTALSLLNATSFADVEIDPAGECHHYTPELGCVPGPSPSGSCNCSFADQFSAKLGAVTTTTRQRCYSSEIFALRHEKADGGLCGKKANWPAATGLLWDTRWCGADLNCVKPPVWNLFLKDLYAAADVSSAKGNALCYMSRGYGNTKRGFIDEETMRSVSSDRCSETIVLDFGTSPLSGDFVSQARIASQCGVVFGPHGAGIEHMIWGARAVLEFVPPKGRPFFFENLAQIAGIDHEYFYVDQKHSTDSVMYELPHMSKLQKALDRLCSKIATA